MSQHDMNIANQGFPAFRSDLNNALAALASTSAGATAPSTTFAQQLWYDSTANLLKMRNTDNDAWITLAYFDQTNDEWEIRSAVIQAVDSAGVTIKTDDGTARITVNDDGTVDFANDVDVAGRIGTTIAGTAADPAIQVDNDGANMVGLFQGGSGSLGFSTNGSESMTLNSSGNLAIGRGSAQVAGIELYKSAPIIRWTDSNNDSYAEIRGNNGNFAIRADHGNTQSGSGISLEVDGSLVLLVDGSGLSFDSGSNYLDDYEEGTWTTNLRDSGGGTYTGTHGARYGYYTKIGNRVFFTGRWQPNDDFLTNGLSSGVDIWLGDLPFTVDGTEQSAVTIQVVKADLTSGYTYHTAFAQINTTIVQIREIGSNTNANNLNVEDVKHNNSIVISGHYKTTA